MNKEEKIIKTLKTTIVTLTVLSVFNFIGIANTSYSLFNTTVNSKNSIQLKTSKMEYNFDYTGGEQTFTVPKSGKYEVELWGAQGASDPTFKSASGGKGAYVSGNIKLNENTKLYIYVGGTNGYNGGGSAGAAYSTQYGGNGGGATDVRLSNTTDFAGLKSRIAVAGAGGGASGPRGNTSGTFSSYFYSAITGAAAGVSGSSDCNDSSRIHYGGSGSYGAGNGGNACDLDITSISGNGRGKNGNNGSFGKGGTGGESGCTSGPSNYCDDYSGGSGGGGGSGYFGGGGGAGSGGWWAAVGADGGGGSSYISGNSSYNAISSSSTSDNITLQSNSNHYSGYIFTNTTIKKGNESFQDPSGNTVTGHSGNGYARITYIGN